MAYRSVARVGLPVVTVAYVLGIGFGTLTWNLAALGGWSPGEAGLVGEDVLWAAVVGGFVLVPFTVAATLVLCALYNGVSERYGGIEIAVVSPRRGRRRSSDL